MATFIMFLINFVVGFIALFALVKLFSNDVTLKEIFLTVVIIEIVSALLTILLGTFGSLLSIIIALLALVFLCRFEGGPAFIISILYTVAKVAIILLLKNLL